MSKQFICLTSRKRNQDKENGLLLPLSAKERTQLRGKRLTKDGTSVVLNLPREGGRLMPGEILKSDNSLTMIVIEAAKEDLIRVTTKNKLKLLKAAYHLGNRHVEIELHDNELFLLNDIVMNRMLERLGLEIESINREFFPECGAYEQQFV